MQLDLTFGGIPLPAAGAGPIAFFGAAAGAGVLVFGAVDLGIKLRLLDETQVLPGVAVSYDLLDLFGGALGVAGMVAGGTAIVEGAAGGINLPFNLFTLTAAKHFDRTQVIAGSYLLDNHHFLPQSANLSVGAAGGTSDGSAAGAETASTPIDHVPVQVQPFLAVEQVLGPHSELALEALPRLPVRDSLVTTGARWTLGASEPVGILAADRIRFKIDAALVWKWLPPSESHKSGMPGCFPWIGLGAYFPTRRSRNQRRWVAGLQAPDLRIQVKPVSLPTWQRLNCEGTIAGRPLWRMERAFPRRIARRAPARPSPLTQEGPLLHRERERQAQWGCAARGPGPRPRPPPSNPTDAGNERLPPKMASRLTPARPRARTCG